MNWTKRIAKYLAVSQVAMRSKLAYPQELAARGLFFAFILFIFSELWNSVLGQDQRLLGFSRQQLVWYLTITEVITLGGSTLLRQVEQDIKSGQVAYLLLRPMNYLLYQASYYVGEVLVAMGCNLIAGAVVASLLVGIPQLTLANLFRALLLFILGGALQCLLLLSIALLSFFVEECRPFYWIYSKLVFTAGGLFIPLDLYPRALRLIAQALPFQSVAYGPARMFVGGGMEEFLRLTVTALIWATTLILLVRWQFGKGVQRVNVNGG